MAKGVKAEGKRKSVKDSGSEEQTQVLFTPAEKERLPGASASGNDKTCGEQTMSATEKESMRMMQPAACRSYVRKRLATEFPRIVDGFVKEAKKGSCNHLKQTIEMLKPQRKSVSRRKGPAERLLEKLRRE